MHAFLGLDVGTTAVKALALDEEGRLLASAAADYAYHQPQPGWVEQDPRDWLRLLTQTVSEVVSQLTCPVAALALSTQGDTALPLDSHGEPLAPARTWMDTRTAAQVEQLREFPADRWYSLTGTLPAPHATVASVRWWQQNLPRPERLARYCLVQDYLTRWLTGRAMLDAPNASRTVLYDIHRRAWAPELLAHVGVSPEQLAETAESGTVVGPLLPERAAELGLEAGVQVVLGGHDQTCAAVGCGVTEPGSLMLSCGTAWVVLGALRAPLEDPLRALHSYCHAVPGGYAVLGAFAGGNLLRWFRDELWQGPEQGDEAYEAITAEAEQAEAEARPPLLFLPQFYGSFVPRRCPEARGAWLGLTLAHERGDLALALLQGVALQTAATVRRLLELGAPADDLRMIGGGGPQPVLGAVGGRCPPASASASHG